MYQSQRTDNYFHRELINFVRVAENNAKDENKKKVLPCPCKMCKNIRVFKDPTTIQSHVLMYGFIEDFTISTSHSEKNDALPPSESN
jgi:hypothetical protein